MSTIPVKIDATKVPQLIVEIPKFQPDPKAKVLDHPPKIWEVVDSTTGTVDIHKAAIFYAKLRLEIPERVSVDDCFSPHGHDPVECINFQYSTIAAFLEEIVLDAAQRAQVIEKAKEIEEAHLSNLSGESIIEITKLVAKRVQRTIDGYLNSPDLQTNPLAEQFAKRIIRDLEYLIKDPLKRWNDYEFNSMYGRETKGKKTRESILSNLRGKIEPELIRWLLETYAAYPNKEESQFGLACADVALSNALSDL